MIGFCQTSHESYNTYFIIHNQPVLSVFGEIRVWICPVCSVNSALAKYEVFASSYLCTAVKNIFSMRMNA